MSRSPQTLAPVQPRPPFWTRTIPLFARLWHVIWWIWSTVIIGGLLVGIIISLATNGTSGLTDPRTWVVIQPPLAHLLLTIIGLIIAGIITLLAYLAHRHQKKAAHDQEHTEKESLVDIGRGVRKLLEDQSSNPVASPSPSNAVSPNQEMPPGTTWNIPFRRNPLFTGREQVLKRLHDQLPTGKAAALTQPQAISGLGGIGKTQTAVEYAYRYRGHYQYIFWVRADKREELIADFTTIAGLLNLSQKNAQDQNLIVEAVKHWLETHSGWLLILDNADDLQLASQFIPPASKGHTLLTTRAQAMRNLAQSIEIEKMEPDEGALFLLQRAGIIAQNAPLASASTTDQTKARQIVQILDGLPLALDQAGAYIEETRCTLASYLDIYEKQKQRTELLRRRGGIDPDHPLPVASTWSLSFQKVERANPAAADLLRLCAFLSPDAIPEEIITQGAPDLGPHLKPVAVDVLKLNAALGELLKYSLVRRNPDQTLTIHRLVQAVLKDEMNEKTQRQWAERAVRAVNRVFPEWKVANRQLSRRLFPQAEACFELITRWDMMFPEAASLLHQAARYLRKSPKRYREAVLFDQQALKIQEKVLGKEHVDVAKTLYGLAGTYSGLNRYELSESMYRRAISIREQVFGPRAPETLNILSDLGYMYYKQEKYDEAALLHKQCLAIREQVPDANNKIATSTSLNNLGLVYFKQGKYDEAEALYKRALEIRERVSGKQSINAAITLHNLANLYKMQGKYEQAEPLYQQALAIFKAKYEMEDRYTARCLKDLADLYCKQGEYKKAEPLYQQALSVWKEFLGLEHLESVEVLEGYADLLRKTKREDEAEKLEARARVIRDRHVQENQLKRER